MSVITRILERQIVRVLPKNAACLSSKPVIDEDPGEFRSLNLRSSRPQFPPRRPPFRPNVLPPRTKEMPVDQDWGSVWPGPRTFHPAAVPLPVRQGYVEKKGAPPDKFANAELMKIPNFLHLTPPVIKRQCEALKKFCTPWPKALNQEDVCEQYFPLQVTSANYCHSSPTIRDPMARIVTVRFQLDCLGLSGRAKDKFLRLVGERHDETSGCVTIVTDRCPTRKQNYDYAMYLITALYHESLNVEPWEALKSEADMEFYDWEVSASKKSVEAIFGGDAASVPNVQEYKNAVNNLMNEGESEYSIKKYGESVRQLLGIPEKQLQN